MKLSFGFKNLPWSTKNSTPPERFVNLNGTRPDAHFLVRPFTAPYTMAWVGAAVLTSAVEAAITYKYFQGQLGILNELNGGGRYIMLMFENAMLETSTAWLFRDWFMDLCVPVSRKAVLDRFGYSSDDPAASNKVKWYFRAMAAASPLFPIGFGWLAYKFATNHAAAAPVTQQISTPAFVSYSVIVSTVAIMPITAWCLRASWNLANKKWTIQIDPPYTKRKKPKPEAPLIEADPIGIRTRQAFRDVDSLANTQQTTAKPTTPGLLALPRAAGAHC